MKNEQLDVIVGLIAGMEVAIVALTDAFKNGGIQIDKAAVAAHFDRSAAAVAPGTRNKELIAMVLRHVATGLRNPGPSPDPTPLDEIRGLLH